MQKYTNEELYKALDVISSSISNCEKIQPKFAEGTSQHSLLKNRIQALHISKALLQNKNIMDIYTKEELTKALLPIESIISKCEKGQKKFEMGTAHYTRFKNLIDTMHIAKEYIIDELEHRY